MSTATPSGPPAIPDPRFVNQMRNDIDGVYELLDRTNTSVLSIGSVQRRHSNRLEEIQQSLDLQSGRTERIEDSLRQLQSSQQAMQGSLQALQGTQQALQGTQQAMQGTQQAMQGTQQAMQGTLQAMQGTQQTLQGSQQQMQDELRELRDGQQQILALLSNRPATVEGPNSPE